MNSSDCLPVPPERDPNESAWLRLIRDRCSDLFQIALLLSADPVTAEANVVAAIASVDTSHAPGDDDVNSLRRKVAGQSMQSINSFSPDIEGAASMLQRGLWPVLRLEQPSRACFVLRTLLGYTTAACARMLGIEEVQVTELLRIAVLQLHNAMNATALRAGSVGNRRGYETAAVGRPAPRFTPVGGGKDRLQSDENALDVFTST